MPHLFTCPHCGIQTQVDDEYSGQQGPCVNCGEPITIPNFTGRADVPPMENREPAAAASLWQSARTLIAAGVALAVLLAIGFVVFNRGSTAVQRIQLNAARGACMDNLQQIAAALNAYAADHDTYPPAVTRDRNGKPMHSWRVLILPYLGRGDLFDRYNLDLPWDSTENIQLMQEIPRVYLSPSGVQVGGQAHYAVITGPGTLFPDGRPLGPNDITDGPAKTLLVVETNPSSTTMSWTEPVDLEIDKMRTVVSTAAKPVPTEIGGNHPDGATAATCDGRAHFLPATLSRVTVRKLITPSGGEALPDDVLD